MEITKSIDAFIRSEEGATATEYSVMIALIILVAIGAILYLGRTVEGLFSDFGSMVAPFLGGGS